MSTGRRTPRRAALFLVLLAMGCWLAACGSSASSSVTSSTAAANGGDAAGRGQNFAALAACLKQHGVTLPSRSGAPGGAPPGGGGPPSGGPAAGGPPPGFAGGSSGNAKFRAALKACGGGLPSGRRSSTAYRSAIVRYVACVRQHGYQLPNPNFSGRAPVFSPKIQSDPKFKAASKPCQSQLAGAQGPPPGGTPGGA
jgi:hypothetical protein